MDNDMLIWLVFILAFFCVPTCGYTVDSYINSGVVKSCYEAQAKVSQDLKCGQKDKP